MGPMDHAGDEPLGSAHWLAATTLTGLVLHAMFGWWWADPVAGLALVPLIAREGLEGLRGEPGRS